MKNLAVITLLAWSVIACMGKQNQQEQVEVERETDSLLIENDSTVGDLQTFQYEGIIPEGNNEVEYQLTIQSVALDSNGVYKMRRTVTTPAGISTETNEEGDVQTFIGIPNDSTAIIYQLVSSSDGTKTNFRAEGDSALTKVDKAYKKTTFKAGQKLRRIK